MKCKICDKEIKTTFLGKLRGTYVKNKGKMIPVCADCQKENEGKLKEKVI